MRGGKLPIAVAVAFLVAPVIVRAYTWDGNAWADPTPFLSPITQDVKDNYQNIMNSSQGQTRQEGVMGTIE